MNKVKYLLLTILSLSFVSADGVADVNQKIIGAVSGISKSTIINIIGWIFFIILALAGSWWAYNVWNNKRIYNKRITAFELINGYWQATGRDVAKNVKLGKGGFEILYLKKSKTWKIAFGGRVGKLDYYFFVMPDGYWYNGMLNGDLKYLDENDGLIQVTTTNPLMRGQYTALEKQVESLSGEKENWWDKNKPWIFSIAFILIAGMFLWLIFREFSSAMGQLSSYHVEMQKILQQINNLASNVGISTKDSGLVPV